MSKKQVVAVYTRVSTQEQAREGFSIDEQERKLKALAELNDWIIFKTYIDPGFSGSNLNRPAVQTLIEDAKSKKFDRVIVYKLDRLSRSQKDTMFLLEEIFLPNEVDLYSLSESFDTSTPFGRAMIGLLSVFAQLERENIKERTQMGRRARISQGYFHGSHAPIGYRFKEGSNDLEVDPFTSIIVKEIFDRFISGQSINNIGLEIEEKYGSFHLWNNTGVRRILKNPIYMGKVKYGSEIFDGIHEPLVSEETFFNAKKILDRNQDLYRRTFGTKYNNGRGHLLTGLLYCGDCGARMAFSHISKNSDRYVCYSVSRKTKSMIRKEYCTNRLNPFYADELDGIILDQISLLASDPSVIYETIEKTTPEDKSKPIKDKLAEVNKQISKLLDLYQLGFSDMSEINNRLAVLNDQREKLEIQLDEATLVREVTVEETLDKLSNFDEVLERGDAESLKAIVHALINKIEVLNDDIKIYWSFC